ncbi:MAG: hypothetical protein EBU96_07130 [Actinobacteria bacterium]|nr:hypothetical protein [Actinomycetota bacterium]
MQSGANTQTSGASGWTPGGGFSLQIPDNTRIGGNPRGRGAIDLQTQRTDATQVASGASSFAMGSGSTASGASSFAIGTSTASGSFTASMGNSTASATNATAAGESTASNSFAVAMGNCTASGGLSTAMGQSTASGTYSTAIGSGNATSTSAFAVGSSSATSTYTVAAGNSTASGSFSAAMGSSTASGSYSFACGRSLAAQLGKWTHGVNPVGVTGDTQTGMIVLVASTTTNSTVVLTSDASAAAAFNQLIASTDRAMAFTGELIGKQSGSANIAAYTITGTLVNNAGTVTMPTGTLSAIGTDTIGLDTAPTLAADNTNKGLTVRSGAKTTTNIRWVCTLRSTEVVYA